MNEKINLSQKLALFNEYWTPKIISEFNENFIKLAKLKGEFVWHDHANEDELFLIIKGELSLKLRDRTVTLAEGECFVVPRGLEHKPFANEECHVLFIGPKSTKHTGDVKDVLTKDKLDWI